jgi:hypothetical protein
LEINVDLTPIKFVDNNCEFNYICSKLLQGNKMGMPVRIDSVLYDQAKSHANAERRTIAGQIEFWALIGKAALDNPDLPIDFVRDLMIAKAEDRSLATPFEPLSKR